jgi:hypothetical protein
MLKMWLLHCFKVAPRVLAMAILGIAAGGCLAGDPSEACGALLQVSDSYAQRTGVLVEEAATPPSPPVHFDVVPIGDPEGDWGLDVAGTAQNGLLNATFVYGSPDGSVSLAEAQPACLYLRVAEQGNKTTDVGVIVQLAPLTKEGRFVISVEQADPGGFDNADFHIRFMPRGPSMTDEAIGEEYWYGAYGDAGGIYAWDEWIVDVDWLLKGDSVDARTNHVVLELEEVRMEDYFVLRDDLRAVEPRLIQPRPPQ